MRQPNYRAVSTPRKCKSKRMRRTLLIWQKRCSASKAGKSDLRTHSQAAWRKLKNLSSCSFFYAACRGVALFAIFIRTPQSSAKKRTNRPQQSTGASLSCPLSKGLAGKSACCSRNHVAPLPEAVRRATLRASRIPAVEVRGLSGARPRISCVSRGSLFLNRSWGRSTVAAGQVLLDPLGPSVDGHAVLLHLHV